LGAHLKPIKHIFLKNYFKKFKFLFKQHFISIMNLNLFFRLLTITLIVCQAFFATALAKVEKNENENVEHDYINDERLLNIDKLVKVKLERASKRLLMLGCWRFEKNRLLIFKHFIIIIAFF
jgi:hypothetical protein